MLTVLLACAPTDCPEGSSLGEDGLCYLDTAERTDTESPVEPILSEAAAVEALQSVLAVGIPEPMGLADSYAAVLEGSSDTTCPFVSPPTEPGAVGGVWAGSCAASTGWSFSGESLYVMTTTSDDTVRQVHLEMASSFEMMSSDGAIFQGGGEVAFSHLSMGSTVSYAGQIGGLYSYSDASSWLSSVSGTALLYDGSRDELGARLSLNGGVGSGDQIIDFIGLSLDTADCDGAPSGTIGVRDPTGFWYELALDCSSCGTLSWLGTPLSEQCVDLAAPLEDLLMALEDA
ncbi:MAG: hypothetical protein P8R54_13810 [Myxococcota bacterium]|nr:hypothetical protein [Myxococcota bacterium]